MSSSYKLLTPNELKSLDTSKEVFSTDVLVGLSKQPKRLSSKYFYDDRGSLLFRKIMDLPEYYLTSCELDILKTRKEEIGRMMGGLPFNLVELGPGDGRKTSVLLEHFIARGLEFTYIPIDISEAAMQKLVRSLNDRFPEMNTLGLVAEYFDGLKWMKGIDSQKNLILFLGSNIGNFDRIYARAFLHDLWNSLNSADTVIIGFDLKKDIDLMLGAYNDSQGITSQFNFNLLERINRELGGKFDISKFRFFASYDVFTGAMESYLVSLEKQEVFIEDIGQTFEFDAWEPIHTEYSYKYLETDIHELAAATGFVIEKQLYDDKKYFVDSVWNVQKIDSRETGKKS